jgi:hypothetical protein
VRLYKDLTEVERAFANLEAHIFVAALMEHSRRSNMERSPG